MNAECIEVFPNYWVSRDGRVHSTTGWRGIPERELTQRLDQEGYPAVRLTVGGRERKYTVHFLVLTAFHGPRPARRVARHLNGVKADNRIENLKWGTPKENSEDMLRHGHWRGGRRRRLDEAAVAILRERREKGERLAALARDFGLSEASISRILRGKQFKRLTPA